MSNVAKNRKVRLARPGDQLADAPGNVTGLTFPKQEQEYKENTNIAPEGGVRTYVPGLIDPGTASYTVDYTVEDYAAAKADQLSGEKITYEFTQSDLSTVTFEGYPNPQYDDSSTGELETFTVNIRVTGPAIAAPAV